MLNVSLMDSRTKLLEIPVFVALLTAASAIAVTAEDVAI